MNRIPLLSALLLIWAISSSLLAIYAHYQLKEAKRTLSGKIIEVNIGIKYWNGTTKWYNNTKVRSGSTLLDVTTGIADVNYTVYPGMGVLVESINGVKNENPFYWMWWMWTDWEGWVEGPVAADKYVVSEKEVLLWYYEDTSQSPLPKP